MLKVARRSLLRAEANRALRTDNKTVPARSRGTSITDIDTPVPQALNCADLAVGAAPMPVGVRPKAGLYWSETSALDCRCICP